MDDLSVGVFVLIGLACTAILAICILRVVNRRAASRESTQRPGDPSHQTPQELQAMRDRMQQRSN